MQKEHNVQQRSLSKGICILPKLLQMSRHFTLLTSPDQHQNLKFMNHPITVVINSLVCLFISGKWHLGLHCRTKDFCNHPLNHGFDFFYGIPLTNMKDYGNDGEKVVVSQFKFLNPVLLSIVIGGLITSWLLFRFRICGWCGVILLIMLLIFPSSVVLFVVNNFKFMNSMVMRDFEVVEQPIRFKNLTQRLVNEGTNFLEKRQKDQKPFLLMMSWIQVSILKSMS